VDPPYVHIDPMPATGLVERIVRIYDPTGSHAFRITEVTGRYSGFTSRLDTVREGHDYRLVVSAPGPRDPGILTGAVKVGTDDARRPVVIVPVYLNVPPTGL
jgi:hypothetical protein